MEWWSDEWSEVGYVGVWMSGSVGGIEWHEHMFEDRLRPVQFRELCAEICQTT